MNLNHYPEKLFFLLETTKSILFLKLSVWLNKWFTKNTPIKLSITLFFQVFSFFKIIVKYMEIPEHDFKLQGISRWQANCLFPVFFLFFIFDKMNFKRFKYNNKKSQKDVSRIQLSSFLHWNKIFESKIRTLFVHLTD